MKIRKRCGRLAVRLLLPAFLLGGLAAGFTAPPAALRAAAAASSVSSPLPAASSSAAAPAAAPAVTAVGAVVADADTGAVYYEKDMHRAMYPASITKILTGLLGVESGRAQDVITVPDDILTGMPSNAARAGLQSGEQITLDEALYTMFLASANDSANAVALHVGGSVPRFVEMMNARAKALGAVDSHFDNPSGLPDANNVTSAYDMAVITRQALREPQLMKYFGAKTYVMPATNKYPKKRYFATLQKMMKNTAYQYDGTIAGKTGWETMSGHTLVTAARRNGRTLICVVLRSDNGYDVYQDTIRLLDYCFAQPASAAVDALKSPKALAQKAASSEASPAAEAAPAEKPRETAKARIANPAALATDAAPALLLLLILCPLAVYLLIRRAKTPHVFSHEQVRPRLPRG